jgi:hypothetical protein
LLLLSQYHHCVKATGLPQGGMVEKALHKHAGKEHWLAFDFSHRDLEDHLFALRTYGLSAESFEAYQKKKSEEGTSAGEVVVSNQEKAAGEVEGDSSGQVGAQSSGDRVEELMPFNEGEVEVLYLTADTDNVLEEVPWNNKTVYVIGGMVDRNRLTRAAVNK